MLARLRPTELRLHMPGGDVQRWAQAEGWLQVFANNATVLVGEAIPPDQLDESSLRDRIEDAEQRLSEAEEGTGAHKRAERDKRPRRGLPRGRGRHPATEPRYFTSLSAPAYDARMDEVALTESLIAFDTSSAEGLRRAVGVRRRLAGVARHRAPSRSAPAGCP